MRRTTLSLSEAALVAALCFGLFVGWSVQAVLAGFPTATYSDASHAWLMFVEVALAAPALLFLQFRGFDVKSLYPRPDLRGSLTGAGLFFAAWLVGFVATLPFAGASEAWLIDFGAEKLSLSYVVAFAIVNGTFEEVFLLGVLVRGLRGYGLSFAIGAPLLLRILYHLYQGPLGAVWITAFGLLFTLYYVRSLQLWPPVFAHILWDIVPLIGLWD